MQVSRVLFRIKIHSDTAVLNDHAAVSLFGPCQFRKVTIVPQTYKTTDASASNPAPSLGFFLAGLLSSRTELPNTRNYEW